MNVVLLIQEKMGAKVISFIAIVVLLIPLAAAVVSQSNRDPQKLSLENLINLDEMMDKDTVQLLWANCEAELMSVRETFQYLQTSGRDKTLLGQERILKSLTSQDTHVKKTILDCLRDRSVTFPESGEDINPRKWYMGYREYFSFRRNGVSRKRRLAEANAPVPAPLPPLRPPSPPFFPQPDDSPPDRGAQVIPGSASNEQSNSGNKNSRKAVIIAVVVTATTTFFVAALFFCCYSRVCGNGRRQNDERPLLSLSLSDYSINGASPKSSYGLHDPVHKVGNTGEQSLYATSNLQKIDSSLDPRFSDSSVTLGVPLQPLTGRLNASGMPPLKPPPGRVESSLRPSPPQAAAPPPPSPPPPPVPSPPIARPPPPPPLRGPPPPPPPRGPPPPPPKPFGMKAGQAPPPPPPSGGAPLARPPGAGLRPPRPSAGPSQSSADEADASKTKLKPFFWDKVMANPDQSMVWHQIKSGSFQFNEEMIESLFGYNATERNNNHIRKDSSSRDPASQYTQIIDPKKAQNLSILLKALNVTTEEVRDALKEGNELPIEIVQTLIKMAPTSEEELKLRMYDGDLSRLGTAERFLKLLVEIPFAFKRLESLLFMCTLQEEGSMIKESFKTLEAACIELRKSRLFLKLLEAVLKTGNRMNDGTFRGSAQAFKLDTLLKLSDVKGTDGKTTLLHFVVQEIIRSEGIRAARKTNDRLEEGLSSQDTEDHYCSLGLEVVSGLSSELENVRRAAILDADGLTSVVSKLGHALVKARDFLNTDMKKIDEEDEFGKNLSNFVQNAEKEIMWMLEEEKRIMSLVKNTADYFHGNAGKDEGLRLFVVVRDFLIILDKVCKEVKNAPLRPPRTTQRTDVSSPGTEKTDDSQLRTRGKDDTSSNEGPSEPRRTPFSDLHQRLFPAIAGRRIDSSSSDED